MADAFHLTGELPFADLVAWYRRADVFMLLPIDDAGSFEGLGLVYLEAGAAGLPAIGTTGSGAEEAIVDGATGLLVPEGDAEAAAAALELVLGDSDMRARMSLAAVQRADEQSWDRLAGELLAHYQALLNRCARVS
jgi:glycosyltransferase involved in cell wall biosynthesis